MVQSFFSSSLSLFFSLLFYLCCVYRFSLEWRQVFPSSRLYGSKLHRKVFLICVHSFQHAHHVCKRFVAVVTQIVCNNLIVRVDVCKQLHRASFAQTGGLFVSKALTEHTSNACLGKSLFFFFFFLFL